VEDRRAAREERKGKEIKRVGGRAERQTHARPGRSLYLIILYIFFFSPPTNYQYTLYMWIYEMHILYLRERGWVLISYLKLVGYVLRIGNMMNLQEQL
jgi:hypothetical protein